jgi:hypothetical protein
VKLELSESGEIAEAVREHPYTIISNIEYLESLEILHSLWEGCEIIVGDG